MRSFLGLLAIAGVITLSLMPSSLISDLRTPWPAAYEHAVAYAVLGLILAWALRITSLPAGLALAAALACLAAAMEAGQLLVPTRNFRLGDIAGGTAGAAIGVAMAVVTRRLLTRLDRGRGHAKQAKGARL